MTGSLEPGKNADVVIWSGDPFSVCAHAERVFIDGAQVFDRSDAFRALRSDFQLGILPVPGPSVPRPGSTVPGPSVPRPSSPVPGPAARVVPTTGEIVAITNARILPVSGPAIERGTLVIRGGRIAAVGTMQAPSGARVIDAGGKT